MMALKTYTGSCHCGKVRFEVDIDLSKGTGRCNCSFCAKVRNWSAIVKPDTKGYVEEIGGAYVSVMISTLEGISPEELASLPVQYMNGKENNWFHEPKVTSYL